MSAENYKRYLIHQKGLGRTVERPFRDTDRQAIWEEVFGTPEPETKSKKGK